MPDTLLGAGFAGEVIQPGDAGYDQARRLWNAAIDKRPAMVARPASVADVVAALRFARERGLEIAVRAGGHSATGHSTSDGGLVLDLGRLDHVIVDPETRIARAGGGALLSALDRAGQVRGLVCPVGVIGHTGVGGLTLGGGMGRLMRRFGLTIDNLRAVELVTADGRLVRASDTDEPDLFWGIRGAGTQFGAVTEFEFELQPFDGALTRAIRMYDARHVQEVWATFRRLAETAPDEVSMTFGLGRAVPEADYPESLAGKPMAFIALNHSGDPASLERDTAAFGEGPPAAQTIGGPTSYLEVQTMNDEAMAGGKRSYIDSAFASDLGRDVLDRLINHLADAPGEAWFSASAFGGAMARVDDEATAFPSRGLAFDTSADAGAWEDPADDDRYIGWTRRAMEITAPSVASFGRYTNEISDSDDAVSRSVYGAVKYARLAALKRAWDPDNVFHGTHNIATA